MSVWDTYKSRLNSGGLSTRETVLRREQEMLSRQLPSTLSYKEVIIDGRRQNLAIINTDILTEKLIHSLPGEDITHGGLVFWEESYWLITEYNPNNEVYTTAKMVQCNHLLKWIDEDGIIREQWSVVEDGTKFLTGELEDRNFVVTRGDTRIALTVAKNAFTAKFDRDMRFLVDDPDSPRKLSYQLTKPFKLSGIYNGRGVYKFVLQEVASTTDDNHELGIADYYKYFPKDVDVSEDFILADKTEDEVIEHTVQNKPVQEKKKGWI